MHAENNLSPLAIFGYNRPEHLSNLLKGLMRDELASKTRAFFFLDGPKNSADKERTDQVLNIAKECSFFKEKTIIAQSENVGLFTSITNGVTQVVNEYGKVIVLEDDLVTSQYFLRFMNNCLDTYADVQSVYSVSGYMFPVNSEKNTAVLLPYISTWGWATWKRAWSHFQKNATRAEVISSNSFLRSRFNLADYNYAEMLINKPGSWGIKWYYSVFIRNGLSVFPARTLVNNNGYDGSGENCPDIDFKDEFFSNRAPEVKKTEEIDLEVLASLYNYFSVQNKNAFLNKLIKKIKNT